jgi:dynein heavy chain
VQSFQECGKGHYNLCEKNRDAFEFSKMKRFLKRAQTQMEDALRSLTETSVAEFSVFMTDAMRADGITIASTNNLTVEWVDGSEKSKGQGVTLPGGQDNRISNQNLPPLFRFEMTLDQGGAPVVDKYGKHGKVPPSFLYTVDLNLFVDSILSLFDFGAGITTGVKTLDPAVMKHLHWTFWPDCASVSAGDPLVLGARENLQNVLQGATALLREYLTKVRPWAFPKSRHTVLPMLVTVVHTSRYTRLTLSFSQFAVRRVRPASAARRFRRNLEAARAPDGRGRGRAAGFVSREH